MGSVYKYRANLFDKEKGYRQDTESLRNGEFFAAKLQEMNDPFEGLANLPNYGGASEPYWVTQLAQRLYRSGIYSLSKPLENEVSPVNELMWSHYADSHRGFCIEYDLEALRDGSYTRGFDISNQIHIDYTNESPNILENDNVHVVQIKAFGTKSNYWKYENEVRLVFETRGVKPIKDGAVKAIYFGLNIGYDERQAIIDIFNDTDVKLYQMNRVGYEYKLIANEIDFNVEYEIVSTRHNTRVENYTILYRSDSKDYNALVKFVKHLRGIYTKPANFTIIDDIRVNTIIEKHRSLSTDFENKLLVEHWLAYSSFDVPEYVWMYPEKVIR